MDKITLKCKCEEICKMNKSELIDFAGVLSLSAIKDDDRRFLQRALDRRLMQLRDICVNPMAVCSELREGEI